MKLRSRGNKLAHTREGNRGKQSIMEKTHWKVQVGHSYHYLNTLKIFFSNLSECKYAVSQHFITDTFQFNNSMQNFLA